jgi:hypothetical protein
MRRSRSRRYFACIAGISIASAGGQLDGWQIMVTSVARRGMDNQQCCSLRKLTWHALIEIKVSPSCKKLNFQAKLIGINVSIDGNENIAPIKFIFCRISPMRFELDASLPAWSG